MLETTDGNIKAIGGALMDVSGRVSQMRDAAKAETIAGQMDQTDALMEAVRLVSRARREGRRVDEFVNQTDIFSGDTISPMGLAFLNLMFRDAPKSYARPKSRDKLATQLLAYVDEAEKTTPGRDMLGHEADPAATLEQIGGRDAEQDTGQGGLFAPRHGGDGEGSGSGRGDGSQHEIQPSEAGSGAVDPRPAETGQRDAGGGITVEPIRARAAVVRGIPKDQPPKVGKVRFSWDEKAGGFVFSRKHADAVRDALTGERDSTPAGGDADVDVHETASGAQQTPLSGSSERQTDAKPKRQQPGDADYTRDDAIADLHALEEQRDGGMVSDARLEDRIRQQQGVVDRMTRDESGVETEPAAFDADSLLDSALDDVLGSDAAPETQEAAPDAAPKKPRTPRAPRSAGEAATSAIRNTSEGVAGIVSGLNALFGDPSKLSSGLTFDEQTYAKAKPMFVAAVRAFGQAGQDIADLARAMVRGLAQNGLNRAAQENMRPYLTRFITDMNSGEVDPFADEQGTEETITDPAPDRDMIEGQEEGETTDEPDAGSDDRGLDQGGVDGDRRPAADHGGHSDLGDDGKGSRQEGERDPEADRPAVADGVERDGARDPFDPAAEREGTSPGNFVITPDFPLGEGTAGQKIKANLAAIRLVKKLEAENRYATPAEQQVLARYVGWGGLKSVFDPKKRGASDQYGRAQADLRENGGRPTLLEIARPDPKRCR